MTFEVTEDSLEVGFVQDLFAPGGAQEKGATTEVVDLAGDALGVVVDAGDEAVAERRALKAGDEKVVLDVASGFFQVEGFEVIADGDALVEGFVGGEAKLVGEVRLAEEDEGEEGGGVHLVVEQEAQLVKEVRGEEVGLVDDQERIATLAGQVGQGVAELGEEVAEGKGRLDLEGEEALLKGEGQTTLDLTVAAGGIEVLAGHGLGERGVAEAIEVIECAHRFLPFLCRN